MSDSDSDEPEELLPTQSVLDMIDYLNLLPEFIEGQSADEPDDDDTEESSNSEPDSESEENENIEKIPFNKSLPCSHSYLGSVEQVQHKTFYDDLDTMNLPLILLQDIVVFPGQLVPIQLSGNTYLFNSDTTEDLFGIIAAIDIPNLEEDGEVSGIPTIGTLAQVVSKKNAGNSVTLLAKGKQRFHTIKTAVENGILRARIRVIHDNSERICDFHGFDNRSSISYLPSWTLKLYDNQYLLNIALNILMSLYPSILESAPTNPCSFAFWLASSFPTSTAERQKILEFSSTSERLRYEILLLASNFYICCGSCTAPLSRQKDIIEMNKEGIMNAYINRYGIIHETLTVKDAVLRLARAKPSAQDSWFPGYLWTIAYCGSCSNHIGWLFTAAKKGTDPYYFWGLRRSGTCISRFEEAPELKFTKVK